MVKYSFNEDLLNAPVRLAGAPCVFTVRFAAGFERCFAGRLSSLVWLRSALVSRLSSDSSISSVVVSLSSGWLVCKCSRS